MTKVYILDASAFINGFKPQGELNFTVSEISEEIDDLESQISFKQAIDESILFIETPSDDAFEKLDEVIKESGDILRLSNPDKSLIALAIDLNKKYDDVLLLSDDYSIQNVLKILNINYSSVLTDGINEVYNWVITCPACKKTFSEDYKFPDCDVCGTILYKRRLKG